MTAVQSGGRAERIWGMFHMSKTTKKWIFLGALTIFVVLSVLAIIREDRWFNSLPASEHLTIAKELLATNHVEEASRHLRAIPATAPESEEAVKLLVDARLQEVQQQAQQEVQQQAQEEKEHAAASFPATGLRQSGSRPI